MYTTTTWYYRVYPEKSIKPRMQVLNSGSLQYLVLFNKKAPSETIPVKYIHNDNSLSDIPKFLVGWNAFESQLIQ